MKIIVSCSPTLLMLMLINVLLLKSLLMLIIGIHNITCDIMTLSLQRLDAHAHTHTHTHTVSIQI